MSTIRKVQIICGLATVVTMFMTGLSCMGPRRQASARTRASETPAVPDSAIAVTPLKEDEMAPDVAVNTPQGKKLSLGKIYSEAPTVLIFYRGGWCPYCTQHLANLRTIDGRLEKAGFQIIALSPDRPELLQSATQQHDYGYRLMSDYKAEAADAFGLAFRVSEKTLKRYRAHGLDLTARSGQRHPILPVPAAYVIDMQGTIRFAHWNRDYKERIDALELLKAARQAVE